MFNGFLLFRTVQKNPVVRIRRCPLAVGGWEAPVLAGQEGSGFFRMVQELATRVRPAAKRFFAAGFLGENAGLTTVRRPKMCRECAGGKARLKFFEFLFHRGKGDRNLEGGTVPDLLYFQFAKLFQKPGAKFVGIRSDADLGNRVAQDDFPIPALDKKQVYVRKDAVLGFSRPGYQE
jgi:hypothetical protein